MLKAVRTRILTAEDKPCVAIAFLCGMCIPMIIGTMLGFSQTQEHFSVEYMSERNVSRTPVCSQEDIRALQMANRALQVTNRKERQEQNKLKTALKDANQKLAKLTEDAKIGGIPERDVGEEEYYRAMAVPLKDLVERAARAHHQVESHAVILTSVSDSWAKKDGMLDIFLSQFRNTEELRPLLKNLIISCLDMPSFNRCLKIHDLCYAPPLEFQQANFAGHKLYFMAPLYKKMVWLRLNITRDILNLGVNLVFSDLDVLWFRDPFPIFNKFWPTQDWLPSADSWSGENDNLKVTFNGGFYYIRHGNASIDFMNLWLSAADRYQEDQGGLNGVIGEMLGGQHTDKMNLTDIKFGILPTHIFGGLCQAPCNFIEFLEAATLHMNCCVGTNNKISRMKQMISDHALAIELETKHKFQGSYTIEWRPKVLQSWGFSCAPHWIPANT